MLRGRCLNARLILPVFTYSRSTSGKTSRAYLPQNGHSKSLNSIRISGAVRDPSAMLSSNGLKDSRLRHPQPARGSFRMVVNHLSTIVWQPEQRADSTPQSRQRWRPGQSWCFIDDSSRGRAGPHQGPESKSHSMRRPSKQLGDSCDQYPLLVPPQRRRLWRFELVMPGSIS
jgi:hypothetical protein